MLSKEEIEARKQIVELLKTAINTNDDVVTLKLDKSACKTLYGYIEELETREQKLIEKLEERRKSNQEEYDETLYNAHIEETNELKGQILEDNYILEILKGEKE